MTRYVAIDFSQLPAPAILEALSFEAILAELKTDFLSRQPDFADTINLESDPINTLMQVYAAREVLVRARVNAAAKALLLPLAEGADLDNLAAFYGVQRLVLVPADSTANPPVAAVYEDDASFRRRVQLALEGQSTAGPEGSYLYWALSADSAVKDAGVHSPTPGEVVVTVLSRDGDGTPSEAVLDAVSATLNDEFVRPLTDHVTVQAATVIPFQVSAALTLYPGPSVDQVLVQAEAALASYLENVARLGHDIKRSAIFAALHRPGVQEVVLTSPASDIEVAPTEVGYCTAVTISDAGTDV